MILKAKSFATEMKSSSGKEVTSTPSGKVEIHQTHPGRHHVPGAAQPLPELWVIPCPTSPQQGCHSCYLSVSLRWRGINGLHCLKTALA